MKSEINPLQAEGNDKDKSGTQANWNQSNLIKLDQELVLCIDQ